MDFQLPEDALLLKEVMREFVDRELIPIEAHSHQDGRMPEALLRPLQEKIKTMGLWLLDVPEEYGGVGLNLLTRCVVHEEVARSKALPFRSADLFGPHIGPILYEANAEQKERFLYPSVRGELRVCFAQTEPDAGSDPAGIQTRAVRDGDHYILNGTKRFITLAGEADFAQVICVTDPTKGARGGISCLMVDMHAPGVKLERQWPIISGDKPWEISFTDVQVPVDNRIGAEGQGFELGQKWLTSGRIQNHGAKTVGMAQRALEMMMDYAETRTTFGQPLADRQAIQFMIADSAIELRAARLMVYETAWMMDNGRDVRDASYMTKIYCTEMASRVVDRAIQVHGGIGLTQELPLEYWYRELRSLRITEGATEVLRWRLARNLARARTR
jgi:acyl-CoA dehydrogenase